MLDIITAGVGLSDMVGVRYYHELVWVYLTWLVLVLILAGVGLSNMVVFYHGWCGFTLFNMWVYLTGLVLFFIIAGGGLSNNGCV